MLQVSLWQQLVRFGGDVDVGAILYNIANKRSRSRRRLPSLQSHKQLAFELSVDVK